MSGVGMIIYASKEGRSGVLSYMFGEKLTTAWMFVHKRRDVVNEARYKNKGTFF